LLPIDGNTSLVASPWDASCPRQLAQLVLHIEPDTHNVNKEL
jgi:hypothetical protein